MREELTGFAIGGNKNRKLYYLIGDAVQQKADTLITTKASVQRERVHELATTTADLLEITFDDSENAVDLRFIGPGYTIESEEGRDAAQLFAVLEGVLLDSVYTEKTAAGLIQYATNQELGENENVQYIHTGGNSELFY